MSKYSPWPWSAICTKSGVRHNFDLRDKNNYTFALLKNSTFANVNLIVAAPDLLEALEKVMIRLNANLDDEREMARGSMTYLLETCSSAIARAKGESS